MLTEELERRGVPVSVGRLTLNPLRGLAAGDVRVMDRRERGRLIAIINEVVLDINYSNLLQGGPFLNAIDLREAAVSLPLKPGDTRGGRIEATRLNARILLPPGELCVAQAEANVHGLHVTASGRLRNPEHLSGESGSSNGKAPESVLRDWLAEIDQLHMAGGKPVLELRFEGDLCRPAQIFAKGTLRADGFSVNKDYRVRSARLTATYSDGVLRLDECSLSDAHGALDAAFTFRPATGEAAFQVRSTLDLAALAQSVRATEVLDEVLFHTPPVVELNGELNFGAQAAAHGRSFQAKLLGHVATGRFIARSNAFENATADFSWDGERWYLYKARIAHKTGSAVLSAMQTPEAVRFSLDLHLNPNLLLPILPFEAGRVLAQVDFQTPPLIHLEGTAPSFSLAGVQATGQIVLGSSRYRGTSLLSATTGIEFKNDVLTFRDFKIERAEGAGTGSLVYNLASDQLRLLKVRTTLIPTDIANTFDRELSQELAHYRFKKRPALLLDGDIDCRKGVMEKNKLHVEVDADGGMDYTFIRKNLSLSKVKATVQIDGERLKITGLEGGLFGGTVHGDLDISLRKTKGDYTAVIRTDGIDFPSVTTTYLGYDSSTGRLDGTFTFSGKHDSAREIKGQGKLTVTKGNVFGIPLFGPLSGIVNGIVPGTGYNVAHLGTCTFTMNDGVVETNDLVVKGQGFSMLGKGKLFIVDDKIDFSIRINAQGTAGVLLSPVSKLLEYTADSTLSKPNWHPKRLPKALFMPRTKSPGAAADAATPAPPPVRARGRGRGG